MGEMFHLATWPTKRRSLVDAVPACGAESERPTFAWQLRYVTCDDCKAASAVAAGGTMHP